MRLKINGNTKELLIWIIILALLVTVINIIPDPVAAQYPSIDCDWGPYPNESVVNISLPELQCAAGMITEDSEIYVIWGTWNEEALAPTAPWYKIPVTETVSEPEVVMFWAAASTEGVELYVLESVPEVRPIMYTITAEGEIIATEELELTIPEDFSYPDYDDTLAEFIFNLLDFQACDLPGQIDMLQRVHSDVAESAEFEFLYPSNSVLESLWRTIGSDCLATSSYVASYQDSLVYYQYFSWPIGLNEKAITSPIETSNYQDFVYAETNVEDELVEFYSYDVVNEEMTLTKFSLEGELVSTDSYRTWPELLELRQAYIPGAETVGYNKVIALFPAMQGDLYATTLQTDYWNCNDIDCNLSITIHSSGRSEPMMTVEYYAYSVETEPGSGEYEWIVESLWLDNREVEE